VQATAYATSGTPQGRLHGLSNDEIVQRLFLSRYAIGDHVKAILGKVDARSKQEFIASTLGGQNRGREPSPTRRKPGRARRKGRIVGRLRVDAYESCIGRWSSRVAAVVPRRGVPGGRRWLDAGCGTGPLAATLMAIADPAKVVGIGSSEGLSTLRPDRRPRARFEVRDAGRLPLPESRFDAEVSGLVLNFVPDPVGAVAELARAGGRSPPTCSLKSRERNRVDNLLGSKLCHTV